MRGGARVIGLVALLALALGLAGCAGDEPSGQAATSTAPGETVATAADDGDGDGDTGGETEQAEPADLPGTAEQISTELDETLADLREVESLDELRDDLREATAEIASWREQLAAASEDEALAEARASLDGALATLETALGNLSSQAQTAGAAGLGALARKLTPDNLDVSKVRSALDELLGTSGSG